MLRHNNAETTNIIMLRHNNAETTNIILNISLILPLQAEGGSETLSLSLSSRNLAVERGLVRISAH
jgi:hypothetical protein